MTNRTHGARGGLATGLIVLLILIGAARAESEGDLRQDIYASEFGGALLGPSCLGCVGAGIIGVLAVIGSNSEGDTSYVHTPEYQTLGSVALAAIALIPASAALGSYQVGRKVDPGGNFWMPLALSYGGCALGAGIGIGVNALTGGWPKSSTQVGLLTYYMIPVTAFVGSVAGAVVGYNVFHGPRKSVGWQDRIGLPSVALDLDPKTKTASPRLHARLLSFRF